MQVLGFEFNLLTVSLMLCAFEYMQFNINIFSLFTHFYEKLDLKFLVYLIIIIIKNMIK